MPNSYVEITSNGSGSQSLAFSFPYLNQTDIGVTVDGVAQTLTTHWSFATTQSIVFVSHPANGAVIRISRTTPSATRVVDFQDGSVLSEADLDNSADQIFFIAQEAADTAAQSIILDTDGKWEAQSKPIKNVTNPTNAQDAVTKNYLENTWLSTSDKTQLNNLNTTNLNTVAGSVSNVNTVAGAVSNVNTVAGKSTEIAALATTDNVSNMDTLAASGVVGNIASVAGISSDVTTVAGKASLITSDFVSDLNTVATTTNVNNLGTVAGIAGNVTSVAGISSAVSTNAANVSAIQNASANASTATTQASNASTSATAAATSATNAATSRTGAETAKTAAETAQTAAAGSASSASTSLSSFAAQYRTGSSDPTSSLDTGDLFYNTTASQLKIYNGTQWENAAPAGSGFLATSGGTMTGTLIAPTVTVTGTVQADQFNNDEALPDVRPSLLLDFANSKTLDPRITFSRGSTATYWDGVTTAKAEENLLPRSQEFDNGQWVTSGTVTANSTTAPDGTTTADTYAGNGVSGLQNITDYVADGGAISGTYAFSVYAKANTNSFIQFLYYGGTGLTYASFDLSTGAVGNYDGTSASITDVGNGWYRCEHVSTLASNTHVVIGLISSSTSSRGEGWSTTNSVYLWGAQLEQRSAVTAYTATSGSPIVKYQPTLQTAASGAARFDHDPVTGESKGLLIEEARTNLVKYSGDLNAATANTGHGWLFGSTLSSFFSYIPAQKIAPDGTQTGVEFVSTASTSQGLFLRTNGLTFGASTYTASMWVYVPTQTGVNNWGMTVDFGDTESTTVDNVTLFDQWYRISVTVTTSATRHYVDFGILRNNSAPDNDDFFKFYVWGAQIEAGSFPTSYIPTAGSTATRAVDAAAITGSNFDFFSSGAGTIYSEHQSVATVNQRIYCINDGSNNNTFNGLISTSGGGGVNFEVRKDGVGYAFQPSTITPVAGQIYRLAAAYAYNDVASSRDGNTVGTDTSVITPAVNQMMIGSQSATSNQSQVYIKKIAIYPKRLSNATLQAMTTE